MLVPIRRALISVSDKAGVVELARELAKRNVEILSTGGTAKLLSQAGLAVTEVASHTGFPEIMDGRVKTLHPKIHGGLLGRRGTDDAVMAQHGIAPIDLLVVNLYPFAATVAQPGCTYEQAVENIDIGGPAMVRAAAKNHESVAVVVDPSDYVALVEELAKNSGATSLITRSRLAAKAYAHTARYDTMVSGWLLARHAVPTERFPSTLPLVFDKVQDLRYGENPHQHAAFYRELAARGSGIGTARFVQGRELSFNNIADADTAIECVRQFDEPACVIVKHANPCGVSVAPTVLAAYDGAYRTDPTSAFGGIIAFNRPLDAGTAKAILDRQFVEVIAAFDRGRCARHHCRQAGRACACAGRAVTARGQRSRSSQRHRRAAGADARPGDRRARRPQGRHQARADRRAARGPAVRPARLQIRQIERHRLRARSHHPWRGRRPDESRV